MSLIIPRVHIWHEHERTCVYTKSPGPNRQSRMPINHFSQPTAFLSLNRRARETHRDRKMALRATTRRGQCWAHRYWWQKKKKKKKSDGLVNAIARAFRMNDTPRSINELPVPHNPSINESLRTAKPGSEHVVNTHGLPLQGYGGGANAALVLSRKCLLYRGWYRFYFQTGFF